MKNTTVKEDWTDMKVKIKARFEKLSEDSIDSVKENMDLLSGKLQHAYGYAKDRADEELAGFRATLHAATEPKDKVVSKTKSGCCDHNMKSTN